MLDHCQRLNLKFITYVEELHSQGALYIKGLEKKPIKTNQELQMHAC